MFLRSLLAILASAGLALCANNGPPAPPATPGRERSSFNAGWKFQRFTSNPDGLSYNSSLKSWMLPSANDFIVSGAKHSLPSGTPPTAQYVQASFNDAGWADVTVPHDWAIAGPFGASGISAGMGRLPSNGVGWYRKNFTVNASDVDGSKSVFLDADGIMSYAAIWLNGNWVGGWPYGYTSFRLDLTQYLKAGSNLLAIRLDNAVDTSRWYPGAGIFRNIWLVKTDKVHVAQYGHTITTPTVSSSSATLNMQVQVENKGNATRSVDLVTNIYPLNAAGTVGNTFVATIKSSSVSVSAGAKVNVTGTTAVSNPQLWGPKPAMTPNLYVAITTVSNAGSTTAIDTYATNFGIRTIQYSSSNGLLVNGQKVFVQGTCNHHDQGGVGTAFNWRATQRQLQTLQDMGSNALRTSHNPPAPEFLQMADSMGFLVLDEAFDAWSQAKVANDYNLLYPDWHEADMRALIRRDKNHPSVIAWSIGNEIQEQSTSQGGSEAAELRDISHSEDPTRQVTSAINSAGASSSLAQAIDIESLNYIGESYGSYSSFHSTYPNKMIWGTEIGATISTRGTYLFPVPSQNSVTYGASGAADSTHLYVTAYELSSAGFGGSPDEVFAAQDTYSYLAGGFSWTGFDYLGEPTPYSGNGQARSSYFGIVDLAGFKKDRYYLYQARWAPDVPMAHILPHWTWPDRVGQTTPVHVFSAADAVELFVNGVSQGRQNRPGKSVYRFRWDSAKYAAGEIQAVAYKNGAQWATDSRRTAGNAAALNATVDRAGIDADGLDLAYITAAVVDANGTVVPRANNSVTFGVSGPGVLVATDNGDPTDYTAFPSASRKAFSGLALAIVKASGAGSIVVTAKADGLSTGQVTVTAS